ncbi:S9 family peptidase [Sporosarcina cyprini]|uniref:S9 family peptidase n=1 Tax=Sporosarcina cyprini TaxID=2910523 RepID=UPI001EDE06DA|nr:S9 family peptidase [Sporosarcina cyprini]MCG3088231.1 S9 family peptidase [Sporosarcina cyprini]
MKEEEKILLDFLKVDSAYDASVIPGTEDFTFITKKSGLPQVWKLDEKGDSFQFIEVHDRVMSVFHSPDGEKMVLGVDSKGNEKQQLYLTGRKGENLEVLVESHEHFHYCGGWSRDGRYVSYSSNRRHPGYFDVFVLDVETKETQQVFTTDANCVPLGWLNEEKLFISVKETNIDSSLYIVNIHDGEKVRIGNSGTAARYESPIVGKGVRHGYVLSDYQEDTVHICKFPIDNPEQLEKLIHWEKWDIDEIALSPGGESLSFCLNEGGISKLGIYQTETGNCVLAEDLPEGVISSMSWLSDESILFTLKTPVNPGDIWVYHLPAQKAERLTFIGKSDTVGHLWKRPELHTYSSFDGLEVPYFIYSSGEEKDKPAVIYVHGGPEGQTKAEYNPVLQYLLYKGFVVVAPNIRGSNGYGRKYLKLDDADKRLDAVADLASLAKELVSAHDVHPDKIGIMGRSYGGFMVLAALTHYPEVWAAGVDIVGMSNLKTFLMNTGEWRRYLRESEYGSLEKYSDYFDEIAPMNLTHRIEAPLLVFHGRNDTRVPVSEAEQLVRDLQERDREVQLIIFEDEGHQTERIENHITMHTETVAFFSRYLEKANPKECLQ